MVYLTLFGSGKLLLGNFWAGARLLFFASICAGALYQNILRSGWEEETACEAQSKALPQGD